MYCYFNNGNSMRSVDPGYQVESGEALLDHYPATEDELLAAFPGRAALQATEAQAQAHAETIAQIEALEAKQHRAIREATLTGDKTRLQAIESQIVELRKLL